ncbi:MAG: YncE family protein [Actinomycetes bacterium]
MNQQIRLSMATIALLTLALSGCDAATDTAGMTESPSGSTSTSFPAPSDDSITGFDSDITNNSLAVSPDEKTAVVSDSREKSLLIYDLVNGRLRERISGFVTPRNAAFINDGAQFVVSDSSLGTLRFYDTGDCKLQDEVVVGPGAFGTAVSPDQKTMYVNNQAHNSVTLVDLQLRKPIGVITGFAQPRQGIKVSSDGSHVFVTNFVGDKVTVVDANSREIVRELTGFAKIRGISLTADGGTLYAANSGRNTISVVDVRTGQTTHDISVGQEPYGASLSPDGRLLFAGNKADDSLDIIDTTTNTVTKTLKGFTEPRQAIVFSRDQDRAYVLNRDLSIARVSVADLAVTGTIHQ